MYGVGALASSCSAIRGMVAGGRSGDRSRSKPVAMSGFATGVGVSVGIAPGCSFCQAAGVADRNNVFRDCLRARDANLTSVKGVAGSAGCCYKCLEPGHVRRYCKKRVGCLSCGEVHVTIFHGRDPDWFGKQPGGGGRATTPATMEGRERLHCGLRREGRWSTPLLPWYC